MDRRTRAIDVSDISSFGYFDKPDGTLYPFTIAPALQLAENNRIRQPAKKLSRSIVIMSSGIPTPERSSDAASPTATLPKPQRVLACVLCQQRKVKCDRKFPCSNCVKSGVQCLSASLVPRQRRRRFPERELLNRLRYYEDLLTKHNIPFEPLHASSAKQPGTSNEQTAEHPNDGLSPGDKLSPGSTSTSAKDFRPKSVSFNMLGRMLADICLETFGMR